MVHSIALVLEHPSEISDSKSLLEILSILSAKSVRHRLSNWIAVNRDSITEEGSRLIPSFRHAMSSSMELQPEAILCAWPTHLPVTKSKKWGLKASLAVKFRTRLMFVMNGSSDSGGSPVKGLMVVPANFNSSRISDMFDWLPGSEILLKVVLLIVCIFFLLFVSLVLLVVGVIVESLTVSIEVKLFSDVTGDGVCIFRENSSVCNSIMNFLTCPNLLNSEYLIFFSSFTWIIRFGSERIRKIDLID